MLAIPGTTNPILLSRLADWRDHPAWGEFVERYAPLVRFRCRRFGLDAETTDEVCQRIWIGLAHRLTSFRYDPSGSFRSWLCQYCDCRVIDCLRGGECVRDISIDDAFGPDGPEGVARQGADSDEGIAEAKRHQAALLRRRDSRAGPFAGDPGNLASLLAGGCRGSQRGEAAETLGKSYAATFAAQKRVRQMLRDAGPKVLEASRGAADFTP